MRRGAGRGAAALGCALLLAAAAPETPTRQQLEASERARAVLLQQQQQAAARVQAAQARERQLGQERAAAAAKLRERERATQDVADRVADLAARTRDAEARLEARARDFAPMLPLLERLSHFPSETLLAVPLPPEQAMRGMLVLGFMARRIEAEAAALKREQADIAALRVNLEAAARQLAAVQAEQAREAQDLDRQIAAARAEQQDAEDAAADAARLGAEEAARADSLRAAIARIEAAQREAEARAHAEAALAMRQRRDADATTARQREAALARPAGPGVTSGGEGASATGAGPAAAADGAARTASTGTAAGATRLTAPVAGTVIHAFGEAGDAGPAEGVSYQAPPAARVVSPCGGRVVFSAPFRSYGQLLIVDCGAKDLFVLAGLDRLDARVGQIVQPGEPVGVMPNWDPRATAGRPSLYVELRHDGRPVNPAPFLRARG